MVGVKAALEHLLCLFFLLLQLLVQNIRYVWYLIFQCRLTFRSLSPTWRLPDDSATLPGVIDFTKIPLSPPITEKPRPPDGGFSRSTLMMSSCSRRVCHKSSRSSLSERALWGKMKSNWIFFFFTYFYGTKCTKLFHFSGIFSFNEPLIRNKLWIWGNKTFLVDKKKVKHKPLMLEETLELSSRKETLFSWGWTGIPALKGAEKCKTKDLVIALHEKKNIFLWSLLIDYLVALSVRSFGESSSSLWLSLSVRSCVGAPLM